MLISLRLIRTSQAGRWRATRGRIIECTQAKAWRTRYVPTGPYVGVLLLR